MSWKKAYVKDDVVKFLTEENDYKKYNGKKATVLYKLSLDETNAGYHSGATYRVCFEDGFEIDAFDYELTKMPRTKKA